jgi:spermidine dehydrogenase
MKSKDPKLGMDRQITRRDLLHGIGALTAGSLTAGPLFPLTTFAEQIPVAEGNNAPLMNYKYPPTLTGMRGNHAGAFEVAHQLARESRRDFGSIQQPDSEVYDLVVVGGGISGLSAAHFYRKEKPNVRILIVDNHDDFGGHAKRNEFQVEGRTLISYGGSSFLAEPSGYSEIVKSLLHDLGVDIKRFESSYDQDFYKRHGLRAGLHFDKKNWGVDRTVSFTGTFLGHIPMAATFLTTEESVALMPISDAAKSEFLRLLTTKEDQMSDIVGDAKVKYLSSISYRDFLSKHLNITEPEVFAVLQDLAVDPGMGIEAVDAYLALNYAGLPGWDAAGLPQDTEENGTAIHRFPDGNASIARLLVRLMIPDVAPGNTMEDIVTARFDYSKLDKERSPVRIRLNSTVTNVQHDSDPKKAEQVQVSYVRAGQAYQVRARNCVLACNNSIIPYLCPTLPESQQEALANQVKQPILMTQIAVRNWQAWKKMGIGGALSPGSYHIAAQLEYPVSLGDYTYSGGPDEPVIVTMYRYPHTNNQGLSAQEQYRRARHELLSTPFETIERNVREQLFSMLGEAGFDPTTDIMAITVNRWAHGYSYDMSSHALFDKLYEDDEDKRYPHMRARKPFGRITIANSDSAASAMLEAAVEQAHRAVTELLNL